MAAVEAGDRAAWLALFTDDAVVEDPIGPSPLNPAGEGRRGQEAIAGFWDEIISMGQVRFTLRESYACGNECANVGRISTTCPTATPRSSRASTPTGSTPTAASSPSAPTGSSTT